RDIESTTATAPFADQIPRTPVAPADDSLVDAYIQRAATVRRGSGGLRVALTALHGVGGPTALATLNAAGITDIHVVDEQFQPDPDFPTVAFPNPEEPGASDAVLARAAEVDADVAIALDPDADRCAIGIPSTTGWRMLSGDET
ncbi:phospho-sugar mutase, partial [Mycolicibacter hiberniae]|nr:phospho-sugar mutase [Mycolicibacter hiberniae]